MNTDYMLVITTAPSHEIAQELAHELVHQKVAACVNIIPGINSIYTWKGDICSDQEKILLIKTKQDLVSDGVIPIIKSIHPYDVPEIIGIPVIFGSQEYLNWIDEVTT